MELSGTERLHGAVPAVMLARFARDVETRDRHHHLRRAVRSTSSWPRSPDRDKPRGFPVIGREEAIGFLAPQPVSLIWGVGKAFEKKLADDGIRTIGQIQAMDEADLPRRYGSMGLRLARLARADDRRAVDPRAMTRNRSAPRRRSTTTSPISTGCVPSCAASPRRRPAG